MRFIGKVALVVGAANGIAAETARIISSEGGIVAGFDRDEAGLQALTAELRGGRAGKALAVTGDAMDEAAAQRTVEDVVRHFGRIDILVNAVGGSGIVDDPNATIERLSLQEWNRLVNFNLLPPYLFTRAVVPVMKINGGGKIVNVSSHAASGRNIRNSAYATAKAGVGGFTRKLARELGPAGINCNEVMPGRTRSHEQAECEALADPEGTSAYLQTIPLRRLGTPQDPARVICFLASSDADYVTGVCIEVNGGQ